MVLWKRILKNELLTIKSWWDLNYVTDKYQEWINDILKEYANKNNTAQTVAAERMLEKAKQKDTAEQKYKDALNNYNNLEKELESIQNEVNELEKQKANWAVTWPEWDTNYNARIKELKDKKKSIAEAWLLLNEIAEEYRVEANKHAEEEQEVLPITRGFYETQEGAKFYHEHFADKVYKNEDWKYYWIYVPAITGDPEVDAANAYQFQKEQDIRSTLMNIETPMFEEMTWVRNQTEWVDDIFWWKTLATLWIWNTSRNYDFDFDMRADFLKNSDSACRITGTNADNPSGEVRLMEYPPLEYFISVLVKPRMALSNDADCFTFI